MHGWRNRAACREVSVDVFYPEKGQSAMPAKRICAKCPVKFECRMEAVISNEPYGVWGGMTERERRNERRILAWDSRDPALV